MKKIMSLVVAVVGVSLSATVPVVTPGSVTMSQSSSRRVEIGYELEGEAAIVTIDILTNGVSIGAANMRGMYGDVHVKVEPGVGKKAYWTPTKSWPGHVVPAGAMTAVVKAWATNAPPEWMVVNLDTVCRGRADAVKYYASLDQSPDGGDLSNPIYKTCRIVLKRIPAAGVPFFMGSPNGETGRISNTSSTWGAELLHKVVLSSDFYMAVFETTQAQYTKIYNEPSQFYFMKDGDCRPVENISTINVRGSSSVWPGETRAAAYDSVASSSFLGQLRAQVGETVKFDLPTEAQWEFACRAGTQTGLYTGEDITNTTVSANLGAIARYKGNNPDGDRTMVLGNMTARMRLRPLSVHTLQMALVFTICLEM